MARPTTAHEPASPGEAPPGSDAPTAFTAAVSAITDAFGDTAAVNAVGVSVPVAASAGDAGSVAVVGRAIPVFYLWP